MLWSTFKHQFKNLVNKKLKETTYEDKLLTKEDIKDLPKPLQIYFESCGFIGKPKICTIHAVYDDVDFKLSPSKPSIKIKYQHYNFADRPERIAFIDAKRFGIPFQGIDKLIEGRGAMTGVIAKIFKLFDSKGHEMDQASLVTALGEGILIPSLYLQDFVSTETISSKEVKVIMKYYNMKVSGILSFNDNYEIICFTTDDRYMVDDNGAYQKVKWSAVVKGYHQVGDIKQPSALKAVWHLPERELVYFDSKSVHIRYNVKET